MNNTNDFNERTGVPYQEVYGQKVQKRRSTKKTIIIVLIALLCLGVTNAVGKKMKSPEKNSDTNTNLSGENSKTNSNTNTLNFTEEYVVNKLANRLNLMDWIIEFRKDSHYGIIYDHSKKEYLLSTSYHFGVDKKGIVSQIHVLLVGDIKTAVKDAQILAIAAMQLVDPSITTEQGQEILIMTIVNGVYTYNGMTYYFEEHEEGKSTFFFEPQL